MVWFLFLYQTNLEIEISDACDEDFGFVLQ